MSDKGVAPEKSTTTVSNGLGKKKLEADASSVPRVVGIFKRSTDAEGNPFHKSFSRTSDAVCRVELFGISDSFDWNRDKQVTDRQGAGAHPEDRALLFQTADHIEELVEKFPDCNETLRAAASFGENFFISPNWSSSKLCVGDVWRVGNDGLTIEITSARWPCYKVDKRHPTGANQTSGQLEKQEKVRSYCASRGTGGIFAKPLSCGTVRVGDELVLISRTRSEWTLQRISHLFYSLSDPKTCLLEQWAGTPEEMQQVINLQELAEFEWRERLVKFDAKQRKEEADRIQKQRERIAKSRMMWNTAVGVVTVIVAIFAALNVLK